MESRSSHPLTTRSLIRLLEICGYSVRRAAYMAVSVSVDLTIRKQLLPPFHNSCTIRQIGHITTIILPIPM